MWAVCLATCALVCCTPLGAPYSAARPQRFMLFHVQRHVHAPGAGADAVDHLYWMPELDVNTPHSLDRQGEGYAHARPHTHPRTHAYTHTHLRALTLSHVRLCVCTFTNTKRTYAQRRRNVHYQELKNILTS